MSDANNPVELAFTDQQRAEAAEMAGYGLPVDQIAILVGVTVDDLQEHFHADMMRGRALANAEIGRAAYDKAKGGDTQSIIWWSKAQMKWAEVQKHEHSGPGGAAIQISEIIVRVVDVKADQA